VFRSGLGGLGAPNRCGEMGRSANDEDKEQQSYCLGKDCTGNEHFPYSPKEWTVLLIP
jgi:hypothetical protein